MTDYVKQEELAFPVERVRTKRKIEGISAVLLPFTTHGEIDWDSFTAQLKRTSDAGIVPAVNMDTGYANLLSEEQRTQVLSTSRDILGQSEFVAGAFVASKAGDTWDAKPVLKAVEQIQDFGGTPIIFQSFGLTNQKPDDILASYQQIAEIAPRFIAFELGKMFAPFGQIYDLEVYAGLLDIPQCIGAKHSSLNRTLEWQRLDLRDAKRPDFKVYTGNDLAIDMVMYGSDYLLGISTFAPDLFAKRDAMWLEGNPEFYELNDWLQYLGFFAFRDPVPAYKHSAAQFLKLRGFISSDTPHPDAERRPDSDIAILKTILDNLEKYMD